MTTEAHLFNLVIIFTQTMTFPYLDLVSEWYETLSIVLTQNETNACFDSDL